MYRYNEIKRLHLEITTTCQAKCPMCSRNYHSGLLNPKLINSEINFEFFKEIVPNDLLKQVKTISFCGSYGDPIMNNDLLDIIGHISKINPNVHIDLHTNASAKKPDWWVDFAKNLPTDHVIHFGIDGLEDTHSIYRIGTSYNKILENAHAFINAGGKARWNFITFKHNEHQLDEARQLSEKLGFKSFHEKQTSRFIGSKLYDVLDNKGNLINQLEPPTDQKIVNIDRETVENYKNVLQSATIKCEIKESNSVFIDSSGILWPCSFTAGVMQQYVKSTDITWTFVNDNKKSLMDAIDLFGGIENLNLRNHTIKEIVNGEKWQKVWDESFEKKSILVCSRSCGKFPKNIISQCRDQFLDFKEF